MRRMSFLLICLMLFPVFSRYSSAQNYIYTAPSKINDGWLTAHLDETGIKKNIVSKAVTAIMNKKYKDIHSILIVKNGKLVLEEYFPGNKYSYTAKEFRGDLTDYDINTIHNLASVTKSITSAIIGIANDKGFIKSINEKLFFFFPEYSSYNNEKKNKITLAHILTMTSGLKWNESKLSYANHKNDLIQLFIVPDPVEYILKKPAVNPPASEFNYNGGGTNLLGEIVRTASGERMDVFADKYLFKPLGITNYKWKFIQNKLVYASGDMEMRPRDMAKFGFLFLNDGKWNGIQIISSDWINMSLKKHVSLIPGWTGYGFQWWQKSYKTDSGKVNTFYADGWGGQKIVLFSDLNMVVVFTGGNYTKKDPCDGMINRYILPAVVN